MISPEIVAGFRRRRITDALTELCLEKTFQGATMTDIAACAGVAKATLYEHFENRADVLEAAVEEAVSDLLVRVASACAAAGDDREERRRRGLAEILLWVADEPEAAWLCLIEAFRGTPKTRERHFDALSRFGQMLRDTSPEEVPLSPMVEDSLAAGVASILSGKLRQGEADRVPDMEDELIVILRAPYRDT